MGSGPESQIPGVMERAAAGEPRAAVELFELLRHELRALAAARLRALPPGQTLQPTALVNEAYIKLVGGARGDPGWSGRGHFFGAAARAMRDVLVDRARAKGSLKRGGGRQRVTLEDAAASIADDEHAEHTLWIDAALALLEKEHPEHAELVSLRFFAGMTSKQIATVRGVSERTVERQWAFARAWLQRAWAEGGGGGPGRPGGEG